MFQSVISLIPMLTRFIFAIIFIFIIDFYAYQAIKVLTEHSSIAWRRGLRIGFWAFSLFIYLSGFLVVYFNLATTHKNLFLLVMCTLFISILSKLLMMVPMLIEDIYRVLNYLYNAVFNTFSSKGTADIQLPSRKKFISQIGLGLGGLTFSGMTYGIVKGAHDYKIHRKNISINGLPNNFNGLKIGHLSDIHTGSFWDKSAVKIGIEKLMKEKVDLIVFTGDLVNNIADELTDEYTAIFSQLNAPLGVYSILGNHDYGDYYTWPDRVGPKPRHQRDKSHMTPMQKANLSKIIGIHKKMGWDILLNENRIIQKGEESIVLLGVENFSSKRNFPQYGFLENALNGVENAPVKILLSHDPSHWDFEVVKKHPSIQLTLSGHTHGAQFGIETGGFKWSPIKYLYKQWAGLYTQDAQHIYVNRGFGYLGYPGRLGIRPEIGVLTLQA